MNAILAASYLTVTLVAGSPTVASSPGRAVDSHEASTLRQLDTGRFDAMRAGALDARAAAGLDECTSLRAAERANPQLADMRAGDVTLSDHDLKVIGIVLLAVLIIIIIA